MGLRWAFSLRAEPSFKCKFLSFQGFCLGWNRIFISLPVQPYEWAAAALWDSHLREEEKEAEDGPGRPQPTRLGQTSIWKIITFFMFHVLICFFLHFQVFLWMRHLRDWIWERLKLWRTFKGLQPSKPPTPTDCIQFEQQLLYPNPQLLPFTIYFSVSPLSGIHWPLRQSVFFWCKWTFDLKV